MLKPIALITAAAAAAATLAATAHGSPATVAPRTEAIPPPWSLQPHVMPPLPRIPPAVWVTTIGRARRAVWRCQAAAGIERTRPGLTLGQLRRAGHAFRGWVLGSWAERLTECRHELHRRWLPETGDWLRAVRAVQRAYPGSRWWLEACSSTEGGHGRWIPNTQGSGAGGWMQYMEGTFWHDFVRARYDLERRGFRLPPLAASWYSPIGQAAAAGWAYFHDRPPGKWTGYRC